MIHVRFTPMNIFIRFPHSLEQSSNDPLSPEPEHTDPHADHLGIGREPAHHPG
jgi:hypothetical protein